MSANQTSNPPAGGGTPAPGVTPAADGTGTAAETLLSGADGANDGKGDGGTEQGQFPSNWREIMAGGDPKKLAYLKRFTAPANVANSALAMRAKMDAGELVRSKPEGDPNDPAVKAALNEWRAQVGVPETPEGYLDKVPNGLVFGEADKPLVESFIKDMHEADAPPGYVHKALQWYKGLEQRQIEERAEADKTHRALAEDTLRSEWGAEYRANLNGINAMFKTLAPEGLMERLLSARMADGTPLGDDPDNLRFLAALNLQINPHGTIASPDSPQGKAMLSEKADIQKHMANQESDYYRGPKDPKTGETRMAARYREILEAEAKMTRGGR